MAAAIQETHRLFHCGLCHKQVLICRRCDRGQSYCPECTDEARRRRNRRSSSTYQSRPHGALNHARRQERYRRRQEKVTHRGPPPEQPLAEVDALSIASAGATTTEKAAEPGEAQSSGDGPESLAQTEERVAQEAFGEEVKSTGALRLPMGPALCVPRPFRCHFCDRTCGDLTRLDFLRRR